MSFTNVSSVSVLVIIITLSSIPSSSSLISFESDGLGDRRCWEIRENLSTCADEDYRTDLLSPDFENITSPRMLIYSLDENFNFTVRISNSTVLRHVRRFAMMDEEIEVDIELVENAQDYEIICFIASSSNSSMKISSNTVVPFGQGTFIEYRNSYYGYPSSTRMVSMVSIIPETLQAGRFTCSSQEGNQTHTEAFRIFVLPSTQNEKSPFVSVQELTVQSNEKGNGFIVPCRTKYRLKSPPQLLWKRREKDRYTTLSEEEMGNFKWDPMVGFQFQTSTRIWESGITACQIGSHIKEFKPSPSIFSETYVVRVKRKQIGCAYAQRNVSSSSLRVRSYLYQRNVYSHTCNSDVECDLDWKMGILSHQGRYQEHSTGGRDWDKFHNPSREFGAISCSVVHEYEDIFVPEAVYRKFFVGLDSNLYLLPGYFPASSVIGISKVDKIIYKSHIELYQEFTCTVVNFVMSQPVYLILTHENQSEIVHVQNLDDTDEKRSSQIWFNVTLPASITHAGCLGFTNEGKIMSVERSLKIIDITAPFVDNTTSSSKTLKVGEAVDDQTLICPITATPPPKYQWVFDEKNSNLTRGADERVLSFRKIDESLAGKYTCVASNTYGQASFDFEVSIQVQDFSSPLSQSAKLGIALAVVVGCIVSFAAVVFAWKYRMAKRQIRNLTPEEAEEFLNGISTSGEAPCGDGPELAMHLPFTKFIESKSLVVARDAVLGKGQYGVVYRGVLDGETVAVKTFKRAVTYEEFRAGLVEVKLMSFVGDHPNVVKFIGADVSNIEKRILLVVMELSPHGSLEKHLRTRNEQPVQREYANTVSQYCSADERSIVLYGFCEQIAKAMEHLESKRVIHGDLAARNVLVFSHGVVKVTDFGYSRQLYENNLYKPKTSRALPWRWASIELLRQMEFSTESDIWAYGVTVWEIFTFGNVPFATETFSDQFVVSLENGLRLPRPSGLTEPQYSFLKECWNVEKSARPRFSALQTFFSTEKTHACAGFDDTTEI